MVKEEEIKNIKDLIDQGLTRKEMCERLNMNLYSLKRIFKKYNIRMIKEKHTFNSKCNNCDNYVEYKHYEEKIVYCSISCANKRSHSSETRKKISEGVASRFNKSDRFCLNCNKNIKHKKKRNKYCSRSCASKHYLETDKGKEHIKKMVQKSVNTQVRRSKNEILFFEKCFNKFNNVESNANIFNGWDADVIIHDFKLAILWNGKWHYEKIREGHSLIQVQNRDRIKIKEIEKIGYTPYVIKDMGRFSKDKVEEEFSKLIEYLENK